MKPLNDDENVRSRIISLKRKFGMTYGIAAGIAFAVSSWGWDGYVLNASHAYFPWIMLLVGLIFCAVFGGISGWLTARFESSLLGILFWVITSAGFAWLMVALPLQINPAIVSKLDPQLGALLNYANDGEFMVRFGASLIWILPFMLITGVTQIPITESAVFSTSFFSKVIPLFFCVVVMGLSGTFTDSLINVHFRDAITSLDATIQFVVDNQGNENTDQALSRQMHARALWEVNEQVQESRKLFVGSYDEYFGEFHVLVKFGGKWVDCLVLYNQPNACHPITGG
jgi:hypothetical protein